MLSLCILVFLVIVHLVCVQGLFQNFAPGGANALGPNISGGGGEVLLYYHIL